MKQLYLLCLVIFVFSNLVKAQNVGIGTTNPETKLKVEGAISFSITNVLAGANINIPENVSIVRITDDGNSAANNIFATNPKEGQTLTIYNNDAHVASFNSYLIAASSGVISCIYINGSWRLVSDNTASGNGFVKNQTSQQAASNFNISGTGTAGSLVSSSLTTSGNSLNLSGAGWGMNFYIDSDNNSSDTYVWHGNGNEVMRLTDGGILTINNLGSGYVKSASGALSTNATIPWSDISGAPAFLTSYTETDPQVGANITNYVPRWNGGALESGVIQDNGTNVGISTAPSTYKLDVAGSVRLQDYGPAGSINILIGDDAYLTDVDRGDILGLYSAGNNAVGGLQLGSNTGSYIFGSGGNIGVGTTNPLRKLEVNNAMRFTSSSSDLNDGVVGTAPFAAGLNIVGINTDAAGRKINFWGSFIQNENPTNNSFVGNTNFPGGIWNSSGNVGIGAINPSNRLHVGASEGQGIDIGLPDDAMGFNGGSTSIRFYGYRDVVSNAIGAKISAERTDRCCGWLSQGTELVFYTNAGLTTSNADNSIERVRIKDDGTLEAKAGFKTERHIRFYKRSRGNGQGGIDDLGNYDMCFLTGTAFRNTDSNIDEDDDYQCNVYSLDINGSADYNEGENEDFSNNFGWNSRPYWRLYSECYQDCSNTTCTATCINFDY